MLNNVPNSNLPIAVIGLGYVGLPLAIALATKYQVIGFDINEQRVGDLIKGIDHTLQCSGDEVLTNKALSFTTSIGDISQCGIYIITVPTPVDVNKLPDLSFLLSAS
ncbi:MAG: hypothetical protein RL064_1223, partial [Bacteroidota bacterium]